MEEDAAKKIADYLRGIKDIPIQIKSLKKTKYLINMIDLYSKQVDLKLKVAFEEWARRARNIKAEEDIGIIHRFIRDRLAERLKRKKIYQDGINHVTKYILIHVYYKIIDKANKNLIPDILIKYLYRKNASDMKNLRDKFNHWRDLLPYMRLNDAASRIQANFRGYDLRKDFNRFRRLNEILYNLIGRVIGKNNKAPAFYKWRKNARLTECDEFSRIIQRFCRKNLESKLRDRSKGVLQNMFKDYVFKLIADMMSTKIIEPDDIEKLALAIKKVICREPFYKILDALRWKMILQKLKGIPSIYDKYRKQQLNKYMDIWFKNAIIIPNDFASKIQNKFRDYLANKKITIKKTLEIILEKIVIRYSETDNDKILFALTKWNKNARKIKCNEDARIIQRFCKKLDDKIKNKLMKKWKNLAKKIMPHAINQTAKFCKINQLLNKLIKKKFMNNLIDLANKNNLFDSLRYLLEKKEKNSTKIILIQKLRQWLDKAKKIKEIEDDAASYIQSVFRGYQQRKNNKIFTKIKYVFTKVIIEIKTTIL